MGPRAGEGLDFEAVETALRRQALKIAAQALEQKLNADRSDYAGPTLACVRCGRPARYAGRKKKTFETVLGEMRLWRAYYHCGFCRRGFCPRDRALGLEDTSLSPGVTRMTGLAAAMVSFKESSNLLDRLAGVKVDAKQVERAAEGLGREIAMDERQVVAPAPEGEIAPTMYLGVDGTGVPVRKEEVRGRKGKQPDGSAKTREVKLATVWSAQSRDKKGRPVRDEGSVTYSAAIESAAQKDTDEVFSEFAQRVLREAARRGFDRAPRHVVVGDGAPWIWNLADEHFPDAVQMVDRFHAKGKLHTIAKEIYGPGSDPAKTWAKQRCDELDEDKMDELLLALVQHAAASEEARKGVGYFTGNRERMKYPEFEAQGLCTSSGVVEAGCKVAVGARLKRSGMHWTVAGADAIIALRCCYLSGRFEDFWERRAETGG